MGFGSKVQTGFGSGREFGGTFGNDTKVVFSVRVTSVSADVILIINKGFAQPWLLPLGTQRIKVCAKCLFFFVYKGGGELNDGRGLWETPEGVGRRAAGDSIAERRMRQKEGERAKGGREEE